MEHSPVRVAIGNAGTFSWWACPVLIQYGLGQFGIWFPSLGGGQRGNRSRKKARY